MFLIFSRETVPFQHICIWYRAEQRAHILDNRLKDSERPWQSEDIDYDGMYPTSKTQLESTHCPALWSKTTVQEQGGKKDMAPTHSKDDLGSVDISK